MKLLKLIIQNFGSIHEASLELKDKGLVSIEGVNEDETGADSNGSGKSTVINAILWCLYGAFGKVAAVDDVVNSETGKDCMVQTSWIDGGRTYKIIRYRKHSKHKNNVVILQDRKDITKAGLIAAQNQINEIMGADETVFRAGCFYQQENDMDIPAMSDKDLKALLERVLPFEDLDEGYQRATEEVKTQRLHLQVGENKERTEHAKVEHLMREAQHVLNEKNAWVDKANTKNLDIDTEIQKKKLARINELQKANVGDIPERIKAIGPKIDAIGDRNVERAMLRVSSVEKLIKEVEEQIKNPDNTCYACGTELEGTDTLIQTLEEKLSGYVWELSEAEIYIRTVRANLTSYNALWAEETELAKRYRDCVRSKENADRLASEIKLLEGQKQDPLANPYTGSINRLRDALRAAKKALSETREDITAIKARLEVLEAAQFTLSPKGLRYHMLETVAPALTEATNRYLDILTDGKIKALWSTVQKVGKEYKEKFAIQAHMDGRDKFGLLSGGQKRKVRLACFFALQEVIAKRSTKNIEIWCGDEIDHALDAAGLERLMVLLNEITKKKSTILVISHNDLREWIPNHATVTCKDGVSTVTGYLNA